MKNLIRILLSLLIASLPLFGKCEPETDNVQEFKNLLDNLKSKAGNGLFAVHFQSIIDVINAKEILSKTDSSLLKSTLTCFNDISVEGNASSHDSYLNRKRQLIISWVSPTDGKTSFLRLRLPKNWDPNKRYPLYIELHGLWNVADNPIDFMTYSFRQNPSSSFSFDDGYLILPWGRGNFWYQGISETDIWEGIDVIENLLQIDQSRKYLTGHSMGGYGTWSIASKSPGIWAAIGIHAGALWYGPSDMLAPERIQSLGNMPTYFVVGTSDGLYDINLQAYNLLGNAGNQNIQFVSFDGGHDYISKNVENMYLWIREFVNENYTNVNNLKNLTENNLFISPNPIRTKTNIQVDLDKSVHVKLILFDIAGRIVAQLIDEKLEAGKTSITWSRGDLKPGIYTYSFQSIEFHKTGKLVLY